MFDSICADLDESVNNEKKQISCVVDFHGLEFDTLQIKARLLEDKLKKAIERVTKVFKKTSSTTYEELQYLISLF